MRIIFEYLLNALEPLSILQKCAVNLKPTTFALPRAYGGITSLERQWSS
jgi:hypothetical protein